MEKTIDTLTTRTLEHHLRNNEKTKDALFVARDEVPLYIKDCSNNVELVFRLDNVLKDPIYLTVALSGALDSFKSFLERKFYAICDLFVDQEITKCVRRCLAWCFPSRAPEQSSDNKNI